MDCAIWGYLLGDVQGWNTLIYDLLGHGRKLGAAVAWRVQQVEDGDLADSSAAELDRWLGKAYLDANPTNSGEIVNRRR